MAFWRAQLRRRSVFGKGAAEVSAARRAGASARGKGERLRIGVTEAAEDGRANRAACAVLADALHVPAGSVYVRAA